MGHLPRHVSQTCLLGFLLIVGSGAHAASADQNPAFGDGACLHLAQVPADWRLPAADWRPHSEETLNCDLLCIAPECAVCPHPESLRSLSLVKDKAADYALTFIPAAIQTHPMTDDMLADMTESRRLPAEDLPGFKAYSMAEVVAYRSDDGKSAMQCVARPTTLVGPPVAPYCVMDSYVLAPRYRLGFALPYAGRTGSRELLEEAVSIARKAIGPC